jgi:WD40 repeat protein
VWDVVSGTEVGALLGKDNTWVFSVTFSADATQIISGSIDGTVRVWDAMEGSEVGPLRRHHSKVTSITLSPDGSRIASGSSDMTVCIWDATTNGERDVFRGHASKVEAIAFSPDGTHVVSGSHDQTVCVWDAVSGNEVIPSEGILIGFIQWRFLQTARVSSLDHMTTAHVYGIQQPVPKLLFSKARTMKFMGRLHFPPMVLALPLEVATLCIYGMLCPVLR